MTPTSPIKVDTEVANMAISLANGKGKVVYGHSLAHAKLSASQKALLAARAARSPWRGRRLKQARDLTVPADRAEGEESAQIIEDTCRLAFQRYKILLGRGVPRELARIVLPVATYSHMFASVDLLNLLRFLLLRSAADSQFEIRVCASAMLELVREVVPTCIAAWEAKGV